MAGNLHAVERRRTASRETDALFASALRAFNSADFESCRLLLDLCTPFDDAETFRVEFLRASLCRIVHDVHAGYTAAKRAAALTSEPHDRLKALALASLAARHAGMAEAETRFRDLRDAIEASSSPARDAFARYIVGVDMWQRDDEDVEAYTAETLSALPEHSESIALLGWIALKRLDFEHAGQFFVRALEVALVSEPTAKRHIATIVSAAGHCALECSDLALGRRMRAVFDTIEWTPGLATERVNGLFVFRGLALLEGKSDEAWFLARDMAPNAATAGFEAFGEVAAAVCARELGDFSISKLHFERAWKLIRGYSWSLCGADERVALWYFASEAPHLMPNEARQALMIYGGCEEGRIIPGALTKNVSVNAYEQHAAGRVCEALGERTAASEHYRSAFASFESFGMPFRSAVVAIDLLRMTGDERYRPSIEKLAKRAPKATIVSAARKLDGPLGQLGRIQREILSRILAGDGAIAIATKMKRSRFTIINHTRKIFSAFGVHSRPELRRACAALDITAESLSDGRSGPLTRCDHPVRMV